MPTTRKDEERKRAIFEGMSEKRKAKILKLGYENWDPFLQPRDPIDLRMDETMHKAAMIVKAFFSKRSKESCGRAYDQGVWEICVGLLRDNERHRGMFDFSIWYQDFLREERRDAREGEVT